MMESFFDPDNLLYFPFASTKTQAEYKPDGGFVHIWFPIVLFHHMKSFHGFLVLDCSV